MAGKAKEVVVVENTTTFNNVIDVKLTMKDLIELAVSEKEIELNDALDKHTQVVLDLHKKHCDSINITMQKAFKKQLLKKLEPLNSVLNIDAEGINSKLEFLTFYREPRFYPNKKGYGVPTVSVKEEVYIDFKIDQDSYISIGIRLKDCLTKKAYEKIHSSVEKMNAEIEAAFKVACDANEQLHEWQNSGKRVKNNIIKQQLASTDSGKALLSNLSSAVKSLSLPAEK